MDLFESIAKATNVGRRCQINIHNECFSPVNTATSSGAAQAGQVAIKYFDNGVANLGGFRVNWIRLWTFPTLLSILDDEE